jgi:hypothetical protein
MNRLTIEQQAKIFLYDLNNSAKEHWFKTDEIWEVGLATNDERLAMEKKYYPTISVKALPQDLSELFDLIKADRTLVLPHSERMADVPSITRNNFQYIIAHNPKRQRA